MDAVKNIKRGIQEIRPPVGPEGDVRGNGGEGVREVREDGADSLIEGGCVVREDGAEGVREAREDGADSLIEGGCVVREDGGDGVREVREDGADSLIEGGCVVREDGAEGVREAREDGADSLVEGGCVVREDDGVREVREDGADSLIEGGCVVREDDGVREVREDGREEGDGVAREHGLVRNDGAYNGRMVCVLICSKGQWIRQHRQTFHQLQSRFVVLTILWLGIRMKIAEKGSE